MWGLVVASLFCKLDKMKRPFVFHTCTYFFVYLLFRRQYFPCPHPFFDYLPNLRSLKIGWVLKVGVEYRRPNETYNDLLVPSDTDIISAAPPLGRSVNGTAWGRVQALHYAVVCLGEDWTGELWRWWMREYKHTAGFGRVIIGTEEQGEAIRVDGWRRIGLGRGFQQVPDWTHSILWSMKQIYKFIDCTSRIIEMRCSHTNQSKF